MRSDVFPSEKSGHEFCGNLKAGAMNASEPVYLEIVDFLAAGTTPQDIVDFRPSPVAQERLRALVTRERENRLSAGERSELDHYTHLEHILRMAKAKARILLSEQG